MTLPQEYATISIIGPTNVGKSSILATLGNLAGIHRPVIEVIPGTDPTKHHSPDEAYSFTDRLMVSPFTPYLKIQDSWGFQKSSEILEQLSEQLRKQKLPITLNAILDYTKLRSEKETDPRNPYYQDLKAWEAVENCDIVLYVIDATHEPSTDRLAVDSLELLRSCERPVIAVFNFYSAEMQSVGTYVPEWKKVLKSKNVFHVCDYDALHRSFAEEIKLLQIAAGLKGGMVLNQTQSDRIHESIRQRKGKENKRIAQCRDILAELLFDVATCTIVLKNVSKDDVEQAKTIAVDRLYDKIFKASVDAEKRMLESWQFALDILPSMDKEEYCMMLFGQSAAATATGQKMPWHEKAISGGIIGLGIVIDCLGGMLLGSATAISLVGWLFGRSLVNSSYNYFSGTFNVTINTNVDVAKRLVDRFTGLLGSLRSRGQASDNDTPFIIKVQDRPLPVKFAKDWAAAIASTKVFWRGLFFKADDLCLIGNYEKMEADRAELSGTSRQRREEAIEMIAVAIEENFEEFKPV